VKVGLVADTHDLLDPALARLFRGCAQILHAGDVTREHVFAGLAEVAPVRAARGNNDVGPFGRSLPELAWVDVGALTALLVHIVGSRERPRPEIVRALARQPAQIVVHGHSHRPGVAVVGGRLFVNPGSAGPRRFSLPRAAGLLVVRGRSAEVRLFDLTADPPALLEPPLRTRL
jgi:putative phosphoesterase